MATTAYKASGTQASASGVGTVAWSTPSNAVSSNNSYTTAALTNVNTTTNWLRLTNFSFSDSDIPPGSAILGIEVNIERMMSAGIGNVTDNQIYLRKTSGQVGDNKASGTTWPTSDGVAAYGGAADTWNASLAQTDVVTTDFGIDISAILVGTTRTAQIDYVEIRITYAPPPQLHGTTNIRQAVQRAATR